MRTVKVQNNKKQMSAHQERGQNYCFLYDTWFILFLLRV